MPRVGWSTGHLGSSERFEHCDPCSNLCDRSSRPTFLVPSLRITRHELWYFSISHTTRRWLGWGWTSRFHGLDGWVVFRRNGGGEQWYYNLGRMRGNCSCVRFDGPFSTRYDLGPSFRFMPRMLLSGDVTTGIRLHPTMGFRGW